MHDKLPFYFPKNEEMSHTERRIWYHLLVTCLEFEIQYVVSEGSDDFVI